MVHEKEQLHNSAVQSRTAQYLKSADCWQELHISAVTPHTQQKNTFLWLQ